MRGRNRSTGQTETHIDLTAGVDDDNSVVVPRGDSVDQVFASTVKLMGKKMGARSASTVRISVYAKAHLEVVEIVTFTRILGDKHDSSVDSGQVGLERVDSGRTGRTNIGPGVGGSVAKGNTGQLDPFEDSQSDSLQEEVFEVELVLSGSLLHGVKGSDEVRCLRPTRTTTARYVGE